MVKAAGFGGRFVGGRNQGAGGGDANGSHIDNRVAGASQQEQQHGQDSTGTAFGEVALHVLGLEEAQGGGGLPAAAQSGPVFGSEIFGLGRNAAGRFQANQDVFARVWEKG